MGVRNPPPAPYEETCQLGFIRIGHMYPNRLIIILDNNKDRNPDYRDMDVYMKHLYTRYNRQGGGRKSLPRD